MNKKKPYTGRDWNLVRIINGATKAAVHTDKKKEWNRRYCRDDETYSDDATVSIEGGGCDPEGWEALEDCKDSLSGSS